MRFARHASILAAFGMLFAVGTAQAQTSTSGAVRGTVRDTATNEAVIGATVVASGPALQGTQATISDETGQYFISSLPPGTYQIAIYYADAQFSRTNVLIQLGKTAVVNIDINTEAAAGETIVIEGRAPLIDQQSTKTGTTITSDYTENIPSGRTFGEVLGAAGGTQSDEYGVSAGGSTSVENTYIVEGINTTDPGFGLQSTNLPNEFIRETEVITGGYNAEYGRSTGAVINVITKSGSNEFHGSVFGYWTPGAFVAGEKATPFSGSAIDSEVNLANDFDIGAELGGPIVKDKLWFHVGVNPSFQFYDVNRIVKTQIDANGDGQPDIDENGFTELEELDRTTLDEKETTVFYTAKLTGAVSADHQGSVAFMGNPGSNRDYYAVTGDKSALQIKNKRNIMDISGKWTSKFNDSKTQVDAIVGYHYDNIDQEAGFAQGSDNQVRYEGTRNLSDFAGYENQFGGVPAGCQDGGASDPYPMIDNCPVIFYRTGGVGFLEDDLATRLMGSLALTQRVQAAGHHVFKGGVDIEAQGYDSDRQYTNGAWYRNLSDGRWVVRRFAVAGGDTVAPGADLSADTSTRNLGAYIQDSWSILPNLTVNAGLRWEQQTLYTAEELRGQMSVTGDVIGDKAIDLKNLLAPRLGVIFDPTKEGRAKIQAHWGRFYESIPMDINVRAFGGELINQNVLAASACDLDNPVATCDEVGGLLGTQSSGGSDTLVAPGLDAQYLDEIVIGGEYEILANLKLGANFIRRDLGSIIEDVSTDGASTYFIANPGEVDQQAVDDLRARAMAESDPAIADALNAQADLFEATGLFDKPKRTYTAIQLTAERRFSKAFMMQATYTYSKLKGNFPGLFSPETEQLDPNLTSMYDLPELMANRYGPLAADRPHNLKIAGYYQLPVESVGYFTFGGRVQAMSGDPINALGGHPLYGLDESFVLPRGALGRTSLSTRFDTHIAYGRNLSDGMRLEAFVDIFNLFNQQLEVSVDQSYTFDSVNPVVGGDAEDLAHVKAFGGDFLPSSRVAEENPNFGNTSARQAPLSARLGLRLVF